MKTAIAHTPKGLTAEIRTEKEDYLLITNVADDVRIDVDLSKLTIRVYSDESWKVEAFNRSGVRGKVVA